MCGINGVFARDGSHLDPADVAAMRDAMSHRGPDDSGLWQRQQRDVVLGHRRLAIVDLSPAGHEPMTNEDGSIQLTFNGEIYNHELLRPELERRGHRFRSRCDAEVLVHLYEEHGPAMVEHLIGMFAFAIWDEERERLVVARDRMGIKPLYWTDDGRRFAFASEIKGLLDLVPQREIDPTALGHYLTFVAVPPPRTLFKNVSKLAPATTMVIDRDGPKTPVRYWDPLENRASLGPGDVDWPAELLTRLETSIERRMMSDVPVGVFLSGGVDSSTNVALMSRLIDHPVNTFSVGFEDADEVNEFDWARRIAARFQTNHHEVTISSDELWDFMPTLVHHQDEPIADPVCVPLHFVSKLAKDHGVTVVHVGEGADELFAGYPTYVTADAMARGPWRALRALPAPLRAAVGRAGAAALSRSPRHEIHSEALGRAAQRDGILWWGGAVAFYERAWDRVTTPGLRAAVNSDGPRDVVAQIAADGLAAGARDHLDGLIYQDLRLRLPELLLMRVDKLTMSNAVEARVPFLDHELVELATAMPAAEKVRDGVGKHVLKRAVGDLLPEEVVWRPKQGFGTPVSRWFRGELADRLEAQLAGSAIWELGYLDRAGVDEVLRTHRAGRGDRGFQLWNVLNLAVWFDHWIARREPVAA
jgi:asparagine synthase (glutamine-hydrolysing)